MLLGIYAASAQLPPPPPAPEITVTDSVSPSNDLSITIAPLSPEASVKHTVTITNDGSTNLIIGSIASLDPLALPYSVIDDKCSEQILVPFSICTLTIVFSPMSEGLFIDTFDIPSNDNDEDIVTITMRGTAIIPFYNNPPSVPQLIYPAEGQNGLGSSVEFRWGKCSDPDNNSLSYQLFVSKDPDFTDDNPILAVSSANSFFYYVNTSMGIIFLGMAMAGGRRIKKRTTLLILVLIIISMLSFSCGSGGSGSGDNKSMPVPDNEVAVEVSGLAPGSSYYWKVAADDGNGGVVQSEKRMFITQ